MMMIIPLPHSDHLTQLFDEGKPLKGKFSSGIEGALASTLNRNFNWKQLSEMILVFLCDVFKANFSNIDSETAEILILGVGAALYYDLKYNR